MNPLFRNTIFVCLFILLGCDDDKTTENCTDASAAFTYGGPATGPTTSCTWNGSLNPDLTVHNPVPIFVDGGTAGTFTSTPAGLVFADAATGEIDLKTSTAGTYTVTNTLAGCDVQATAAFELLPAETLTVQEIHFVVDGEDKNIHYYILAEKETTHPELKDETKFRITWYWVKPDGAVRDITDSGNPGESAGSGAFNYFIEADPETGTPKTNEALVVDVINLSNDCLTRLTFGKPLAEMPEPGKSL